MASTYRILADIVVAIHFGYVAFVIVGLLLTLVGGLRGWRWIRNVWFRSTHLTMIAIVVVEAWCGLVCPLTTWENKLRTLAGTYTYSDGFFARFLHDTLFFDAEPWVFTLGYSLFGLAVLATFLWVPPNGAAAISRRFRRATKEQKETYSERSSDPST